MNTIKTFKEKHDAYLKEMMKRNNIYSIELFNDGFHIYKNDNIFIPYIIVKPEDCSFTLSDYERPYWYELGNYFVLSLNFLNGDFEIYDMY